MYVREAVARPTRRFPRTEVACEARGGRGYIRLRIYMGCIGILEKKMETTILTMISTNTPPKGTLTDGTVSFGRYLPNPESTLLSASTKPQNLNPNKKTTQQPLNPTDLSKLEH